MRAFFAPRISFLLVDGDGVMVFGINAGLVEELQHFVALAVLRLDDVEMVDMAITGHS